MINKDTNTIKCDNCNTVISIDKDNLRKWATRHHIDRLSKINKHYCPICVKLLDFYPNGVYIF